MRYCYKSSIASSKGSSILPLAQKAVATPVFWSAELQKKTASDYKKDRVEKYAQYSKENEILLIPEFVLAVEPKTLSFVVTDPRTRRLVRLEKESFEELLKTADIPGGYFCHLGCTATNRGHCKNVGW